MLLPEASAGSPIAGGDLNIGTNRSLEVIGEGDNCRFGVGIGPCGVIAAILEVKGCRHIGQAASVCFGSQADSAHFLMHLKWLADPQHKFAMSGDISRQIQQQSPFFVVKKFIGNSFPTRSF